MKQPVGLQVVDLHDVRELMRAVVGGKATSLGELTRMAGVRVPSGFCVTTDAYDQVVTAAPSLVGLVDRLSRVGAGDRAGIGSLSAEVCGAIETTPVPDDVAALVTRAVARHGQDRAYAVRSSATAEDLPGASFAGQQDSHLNVVGPAAVLEHVRRCWASLFTERAVTYRIHHGFDHRTVKMAVIVQRMVDAVASGVLFTADPVTSNRRVATVEAVRGLGEELMSGRARPDVYTARDGAVSARSPQLTDAPVLADAQVEELVALGRRVAAHFGAPQDIEWCLDDGDAFAVVQARPITTLFPIPAAAGGGNHVYVSVGHQQMMTDPLKPLGLSVWQQTAGAPMAEAGGRLFVDVTQALASPASRPQILGMLGRSDPLIGDALHTIVERGNFLPPPPDAGPDGAPPWVAPGGGHASLATDSGVVEELIAQSQADLTALNRDIATRAGAALTEFILANFVQWRERNVSEPRSLQVVMAGIEAAWWLNDHMHEWLGETNAADVLTQSVPHNVTSEMGLALLNVADAIRPYPNLVAYLQRVEEHGGDDESFLDELGELPGAQQARGAIQAFLDRYGMRCVGEIDITRPRWSERPTTLLPAILTNVRAFAPGAAEQRFGHGLRQAQEKERDLLERLRVLPDGEGKVAETKRMIDRVRTFAGYREYPKYAIVSRYFIYKQALLEEAGRLVQAGVLHEAEDIFYLTLHEFHEVVSTHRLDAALIGQRKDAFTSYQALTPPRVLTSDGEAVAGTYRREDLPAEALPGLPVSAGTVQGRARVIMDIAQADLEPGDILVTAYTDPSWTPVFPVLSGLVTEVGGLMTHGAVIAREYGLPAVVGVQHATQLIRDGQQIRLHGSEGYLEILPEPHPPHTPPDETSPSCSNTYPDRGSD